MKTLLFFLFCLLNLTFYSCRKNQTNHKIVDECTIVNSSKNQIDDSIYKYITKYLEYNSFAEDKVYQIFLEQKPDSVIYYITFEFEGAQLEKLEPSSYIKINKNLILIYCGDNYLFANDTSFLSNLRKEILKIGLEYIWDRPRESAIFPLKIEKDKKSGSIKAYLTDNCPYDKFEVWF